MPRPLRIEYENAWYHVMNRGANRQAIYKSTAHRNLFYAILDEIVDQFQIEIHAFCLMSNHYHLLVKTPYANLSKAMRHLDGVYTQRYNRASSRDGSLFRGRYKAILVDSDDYLLQVSRYIHLNPIMANICNDPLEFQWSSYRSYVNEELSIAWLKTSDILNQMTGSELRLAYSIFIAQGVDEETQYFYDRKLRPSIYGKKTFIKAHLNKIKNPYLSSVLTDVNRTQALPGKEEILRYVMEHFQISSLELHQSTPGKKNIGKIVALYLLRQLAQASHNEISEIFSNIQSRSIGPLIGKAKKLISTDFSLKSHVEKIITKVNTG